MQGANPCPHHLSFLAGKDVIRMMKYILFTFAILFLAFFAVPKALATQPDFQVIEEGCELECTDYDWEWQCVKRWHGICIDWDKVKVCREHELVCTEPEVTPTPTEVPEPTPTNVPGKTPPPTAPQCTGLVPALVAVNPHVIRNGSNATVNYFAPGSDNSNIYYKENGQENWTHSERDVRVENGYVSRQINHLNPSLGYTFGVQLANSCAGGETVTAVIVDPPAMGKTFTLSYWEVL